MRNYSVSQNIFLREKMWGTFNPIVIGSQVSLYNQRCLALTLTDDRQVFVYGQVTEVWFCPDVERLSRNYQQPNCF